MLGLALLAALYAGESKAQCYSDRAYSPNEIAGSTFYSTREQTKFSPNESHYPLPRGAQARYCFSRGCTGQLEVRWSHNQVRYLQDLRARLVRSEDPKSELRFIKAATLQMEKWLYTKLARLDSATVQKLMARVARNYGSSGNEGMEWMTKTMGSYDRFNKECATYAMEASQHLLVLANLGLLQHWNVKAPIYRAGIPGHWTAGLQNRATCDIYRFDLNTSASARYSHHQRGSNPADLALRNPRQYSYLYPGMDHEGRGRATGRTRPKAVVPPTAVAPPAVAVTKPPPKTVTAPPASSQKPWIYLPPPASR